jgi:hypothetical protein
MYVTLMSALFLTAFTAAPVLSAPLGYIDPSWLIYVW